MDVFEAIRTRRSIRSFTEEPVSQEDMDRMLEAAMCAPSANNRQPWHFVVIRDREMLRRVAEVHPYAKMAAGAAAAVRASRPTSPRYGRARRGNAPRP